MAESLLAVQPASWMLKTAGGWNPADAYVSMASGPIVTRCAAGAGVGVAFPAGPEIPWTPTMTPMPTSTARAARIAPPTTRLGAVRET